MRTGERTPFGSRSISIPRTSPTDIWRKILIADPISGRATFRSTTMYTPYMPRAELRPESRWYLDNSMQDTSVEQARILFSPSRLGRVTRHP